MLTPEEVAHVARLARLELGPAELETMRLQLSSVLDHINRLNEVDTSAVEPMTSVVKVSLKMREDTVTDGGQAVAVTQNAPGAEDNFFAVPKVVE